MDAGPGEPSAERIAKNNAIFRDANEQLRRSVADHRSEPSPAPFICECADQGCTRVLLLDTGTYERIRTNPRWFLVVPGHETPAEGWVDVVERHADFLVVEKLGRAGDLVEGDAVQER